MFQTKKFNYANNYMIIDNRRLILQCILEDSNQIIYSYQIALTL